MIFPISHTLMQLCQIWFFSASLYPRLFNYNGRRVLNSGRFVLNTCHRIITA